MHVCVCVQLLQRRSTRRIKLHHNDKSPLCKTHKKPLDTLCNDCNEVVCLTCARTSHKTHVQSTVPELEHVLKEKAIALRNLIQPGCEVSVGREV